MDQNIKDASGQKLKKNGSDIGVILFVLCAFILISYLQYYFLASSKRAEAYLTNDANKSYLTQMRIYSAIHFNSNDSFIGLEDNYDYDLLSKMIVKKINYYDHNPESIPWHISFSGQPKDPFSQQISEDSFCAKAALVSFEGKYWCVDNYGYEGPVTEEYCTAEKPYCETPSLPQGYTINRYTIREKTEVSCQKRSDCVTPAEYLLQSSCPFTSLCLEGKCAVICPAYQD